MFIPDQAADTNHQQLVKYIRVFDAPDFVKKASFEDIGAIPDSSLTKASFAHPSRHLFRCDNPAATWVSAAFIYAKKAEIKPDVFAAISNNLTKAAEYHGVTKYIKDIQNKIASSDPIPENKLADSEFAIVFMNDTGEKERHLPLRNNLEIKAAAMFLKKHRDKFAFEIRKTIAEKILDKSNTHGTSLAEYDEFLEKTAGIGVCAAEEAAELIWDRVNRIGSMRTPNALQLELAKLARHCLTEPNKIQHPHSLHKIANIIDNLDREHHFDREYDKTISRPEEVLFNITMKAASRVRAEHVSTTAGNIYKLDDFKKLAIADIRAHMGDEFANEISAGGLFVDPEKMAAIVPTLPRGDAEYFDKLLSKFGIEPYAKEAAHQSIGFSHADLLKLADCHEEAMKSTCCDATTKCEEPTDHGSQIAAMAKVIKSKAQSKKLATTKTS